MPSQHIVLIPRSNIQDGRPLSVTLTVPPDGSKVELLKATLILYAWRYRRSTSITFNSDTHDHGAATGAAGSHSHVAFKNAGTDSAPSTSATQKVVGGDGTEATAIWVTTESGAASENVMTDTAADHTHSISSYTHDHGFAQSAGITEGDLPLQVRVLIDGTQIADPKDATTDGEQLFYEDVTSYLATPGSHTIQVLIGTGAGEVGAVEVHLVLKW